MVYNVVKREREGGGREWVSVCERGEWGRESEREVGRERKGEISGAFLCLHICVGCGIAHDL